MACDLIVAAEDARFSMAYGRIGLSPDGGGSWPLARGLPCALALELIWFGKPLTARERQSYGLVNRVTDSGQPLAEALHMAQRLALCAPNALASAKELVNPAQAAPLNEHLHAERKHFVDKLFDANSAEGLEAFFEKRAPRFR